MSMTLEEASRILTYLKDKACSKAERVAISMAVSTLRPISREQVEKVWRGYWIHEEIQSKQSTTGYFKISSCECSKCGCYVQQEANFCPNCGAPMTDEAVQMVVERWEVLHDNCT